MRRLTFQARYDPPPTSSIVLHFDKLIALGHAIAAAMLILCMASVNDLAELACSSSP